MNITAQMVKELRDSTGAGMMDAKKALVETNGDAEAAVDWLRTKGLAKAAKKADRLAAEGLVGVATDEPVEVLEASTPGRPGVERADGAGFPDRNFVTLAELGRGVSIQFQGPCDRRDGVGKH